MESVKEIGIHQILNSRQSGFGEFGNQAKCILKQNSFTPSKHYTT